MAYQTMYALKNGDDGVVSSPNHDGLHLTTVTGVDFCYDSDVDLRVLKSVVSRHHGSYCFEETNSCSLLYLSYCIAVNIVE